MKKLFYVLVLLSFTSISYGQKYKRKSFDYANMKEVAVEDCKDSDYGQLNRIIDLISSLRSKQAAEKANTVYKSANPKCIAVYEVCAWAHFRSGDWMKGIEIIEKGISKLGPQPDLILRRGYMNLEMAELGTSRRDIDGNSVFLPKSKSLKYNEKVFERKNFELALEDFKYIADTYQARETEIYITGYIYQKLENYTASNEYLRKLENSKDYSATVALTIIDNLIQMKDYEAAEKSLEIMEKANRRNPDVYEKYVSLYDASGNKEKLEECKSKSSFYSWVPEYCDLSYSAENFKAIRYFLEDHTAAEKIKRLNELKTEDENKAIDIYITVLNTHANHGNGVEVRTEELLIEIGEPAVLKVIQLMENAPSTCTITKAASVLAEIKDPRGWQPMVDYLPRIENLPFTLIPPEIPEQIIKFDREKGLVVMLEWIKGQLQDEGKESDDPFAQLGGMFTDVNMFMPLKVYEREELVSAAEKLNYSDRQVELLLEKVFGKEESENGSEK